jgi:hypothetical protein
MSANATWRQLPVVTLVLAITACSPAPSAQSAATAVRAALSRVSASYEWNAASKRYRFFDKAALERLVGSADDQIVRDLVDCLDDGTPSATLLKRAPVPVGVVCYEALNQIVYYEPTEPSGDIAQRWRGHIDPTATLIQLQEAKRAWTEVLQKKAYRRL